MVLVGSVRSVLAPLDLECGPLGSEYDDQVGYALIVIRVVLEDETAGQAILDPGYEATLVVSFEHGSILESRIIPTADRGARSVLVNYVVIE